MSVETPPIFIQSGGETAERARRALAAFAGARGGIVASGDLAVVENGTPNMTVNVASGKVIIPGTEGANQGVYVVENIGTLNVALAAADPTNARKDLIVAKVQDAAYSGGVNAASIVAVTGTPAGSPVEPATPANAWVLAMIDVPALDTAITNSQITDRRTTGTGQKGRASALGGAIACTSSNRPAAPFDGMVIYETDTDSIKVYDGTNWLQSKRTLGFAEVTADQSGISSGGAETDLTSLTTTVTVPVGSRIRISSYVAGAPSATGERYTCRIKEDGVTIQEAPQVQSSLAGVNATVFMPSRVRTGLSGSHTYKLTMTRLNGTGSFQMSAATFPAYILVEDIT